MGFRGRHLISRGTSGYQSEDMDVMVQGLGFKFRVALGSLGGSGGLSKWLNSEARVAICFIGVINLLT